MTGMAVYDRPLPAEVQTLVDRGALFVVNHSGGKDSQAMFAYLSTRIPAEQLVAVHADLGRVEWDGAQDLKIAARLNPDLYREYVQLERSTGQVMLMPKNGIRRTLEEVTGVPVHFLPEKPTEQVPAICTLIDPAASVCSETYQTEGSAR